MFKRSFLLVTLISLMVFVSAFASQLWITKDLPSSYDTGLSIEKGFKTSKTPILVEFYSDSCGTCKRLSPIIRELKEGPYKNRPYPGNDGCRSPKTRILPGCLVWIPCRACLCSIITT